MTTDIFCGEFVTHNLDGPNGVACKLERHVQHVSLSIFCPLRIDVHMKNGECGAS